MDKMLMAFNLPSNIMIEQADTKTISILLTGYEHSNFRFVWPMRQNYHAPVIIFKLKIL
jgi:hypothetical protein